MPVGPEEKQSYVATFFYVKTEGGWQARCRRGQMGSSLGASLQHFCNRFECVHARTHAFAFAFARVRARAHTHTHTHEHTLRTRSLAWSPFPARTFSLLPCALSSWHRKIVLSHAHAQAQARAHARAHMHAGHGADTGIRAHWYKRAHARLHVHAIAHTPARARLPYMHLAAKIATGATVSNKEKTF